MTQPDYSGWVPIRVRIRRNADGVERVVEMTEPPGFGEQEWGGRDYMWSEGNYSCDCNRAGFFAEAAGEAWMGDGKCGDGVAYTVVEILDADGNKVYGE